MPELRNCSRSEVVKVSGCAKSCTWREGLMTNGLNISITVVRPTRLIARDEYSTDAPANRRYRPLLINGAASVAAAATAVDLMSFRRVIRREMISSLFIV